MLPPSAIAGVSLVCALVSWVFTQPMTLRLTATAAAAMAVLGAVMMRHWDAEAGKQVAELTRARTSDEWRFEERVAELESGLDESRELRDKLEQRLRVKRTELTGLRNEHAALLRRYAAAETSRASVLEERRMLEIEAAVPAHVLTAGSPDAESAAGADDRVTVPAAGTEGETTAGHGPDTTAGEEEAGRTTPPRAFSTAGSTLFLRADAALARLARHGAGGGRETGDDRPARDAADAVSGGNAAAATTDVTEVGETRPPAGAVPSDNGTSRGDHGADDGDLVPAEDDGAGPAAALRFPWSDSVSEDDGTGFTGTGHQEQPPEGRAPGRPDTAAGWGSASASADPDSVTTPEESGPAARSAQPGPPASSTPPGSSVRSPSGHFTVPTAVAVVPQTEPVRRPVSEGTFDFFGMQREADEDTDAAEAEASASYMARAEPEPGPANGTRGVGRVIDLTEHEEPGPAEGETGAGAGAETGTKGLRSAAS